MINLFKRPAFRFILLILLIFSQFGAKAAIPLSAKNDPRFELGYLVVTHYEGVYPDGTGDSYAGIQQAINDAYDNKLVVLFPTGTYQVSDVLKCYHWAFWDANRNMPHNPPGKRAHILAGSLIGSARPVIRLTPDAIGFDDPLNPKPVLVWRYFEAINKSGTTKVEPDNPLTGIPANFKNSPAVIFEWEVRNIDINVNGHAGAIGGAFTSAQYCGIYNMRVDATGGYCGFYGIPGRNSFTSNVEVEGGRYGIINSSTTAGACLVGARLYNQTEYAITSEDFCPLSVVGFHIISKTQEAVVVQSKEFWSSGSGTMTLVDGKIEMIGGGIAVKNPSGRNIHLSNVYIKNADNLIQSGQENPLAGSGKWERIIEYTCNDQTVASGNKFFNTRSLINGVKSRAPEPLTRLETSEPPESLISRHTWSKIPSYEGETDGTLNVKNTPYSAKGDGITDDWQAIQTAIDDTPNGKIFLPKGNYVISRPLLLKSNTQLFGMSQSYSNLVSNSTWKGGSDRSMVETTDDSDASTFFGFTGFDDEATSADNITGGYIHWRAGRNSMIMLCRHRKKWGSYYGQEIRYNFWFSGNGGGRHFIAPSAEQAADNAGSRQVYVNGTSQSLIFYGLNVECTKKRGTNPNIDKLGSNVEIINSSNIRIHSMKREGNSPSVIVRDSKNIAVYGMGRLNLTVPSQLGGV
jgi:hypothetical protein